MTDTNTPRVTLYLTSILIAAFACQPLYGQDQRRVQRRQFVEDLLKGLIESQLEPNNARPSNPQFPARPGIPLPGQPLPAIPFPNPGRPNQLPIQVEVSREMLAARQHLANWRAACSSLIAELRHHEYEVPELRSLLADALRIQAAVELLSRKAQVYATIDPLLAEFQIIDRDWRVLAHRLEQTRGLPRECSQFIGTIVEIDSQLCGLFEIQPQIDRRELMRLTTEFAADYNGLLQDVYYSAREVPGGNSIIQSGQQLQQMISQATVLIQRGDYDSIVTAYRQCSQQWKAFSRQLNSLPDRRLRRAVQKIEATGKRIHEQLWLPVELDRDYLASMTVMVAQDSSEIFDSISMTNLLSLPQPGMALVKAREFQQACNSFKQGILSNQPIEDLQWDFRLFEVQWDEVHALFHDFKVPLVGRKLEDIQFSMDILAQTFGDSIVIDHETLVQLASNLSVLCQQVSMDVHQRVVQPRYERRFHDQICRVADQLNESANDVYRQIVRLPDGSHKRRSSLNAARLEPMFQQWVELKSLMNRCQPEDRRALAVYRRQIEPLMVKLQVVFTDR